MPGLSGWVRPTPEQLAALPDDPQGFHDWMRAETAGEGRTPDQQMVVFAGVSTTSVTTGVVDALGAEPAK